MKDVYGSDKDARLDQNGLPDHQDSEAMETLNGNEQTSTSSRRQGARNHTTTMKAPEAIADGLLDAKRKERANDSQSRSSRRTCRNVEPPSLAQITYPAAAMESNARMDIGYAADGNNERMVGNSHFQSERKGLH